MSYKNSIANTFNHYFVSVGETYAMRITKPLGSPPRPTTTKNWALLESVNEKEIITTIECLTANKSPGIDNKG